MDARERRTPLTIHLEGPALTRNRMALRDLILFAGQLQTAIDRIGRVLLGQDTSVRPGRKPAELERACALEIVEVKGGSLTMVCDLPQEEQTSLLGHLGEEALTSFVQGIEAIDSQQRPYMPKGYDKGVLLALREGGKLLDHGIGRITFDLRTPNGHWNPVYTPDTHTRLVAQIQEPVENKRTVEGRLLMGDFRETGLRCRLHPSVGSPVSCTFGEEQREAILAALTRYVRLVGEARETDGTIQTLRIEDVEILDRPGDAETGEQDINFDTSRTLEDLAEQQGVAVPAMFDSLLGDFWPEDENIDEFTETVRTWRREEKNAPNS